VTWLPPAIAGKIVLLVVLLVVLVIVLVIVLAIAGSSRAEPARIPR
jgi:hypothetical protein